MQAINKNFLPWLNQTIPLTQYMGIEKLDWQQEKLIAQLSLKPLVNDKQTAFGGGLVGVATLLGWCYTTLYLQSKQINCPVVIKEANQRYLKPITSNFELVCSLEKDQNLELFLSEYKVQKKASLNLQVTANNTSSEAFIFTGCYVALKPG